MENYLVLPDSKILPLIGAVTYSTGDGLDVSSRYGYDYSNAPQSLVYRKRNTALTASVQLSFNNRMCVDAGLMNILEYIDDIQDSVGRLVKLYWNGRNTGSFILLSAQFSATVDHLQIFPDMAVSMSFTEGFVRYENLSTAVSTLNRPTI